MTGSNFLQIPDNAIGIIASDNDNPTENIDTSDANFEFRIKEKASNVITFEHIGPSLFSRNYYLGVIVSADRQVVYWVNDTKPLP